MVGTAAAGYVAGTIYDGTTPVPNAVVTAYKDSDLTQIEGTDVANDDGTYAITLDTLGEGNTVYVKAVKGGSSGTNNGVLETFSYTVNDYAIIEFDIAIVDILIPEFATIAIPASIALIGGLLFMRRKN